MSYEKAARRIIASKAEVDTLFTSSSNGNIFLFTGHLCGEITGHGWITGTNASDAERWCFLWSAPWASNGEAGDLRRHYAPYDVNVMFTIHSRKDAHDLLCFVLLWLCHQILLHDDVIKWKHFPRNWPFVRGIHRSRWIPRTKASDAELWCFIWSASE